MSEVHDDGNPVAAAGAEALRRVTRLVEVTGGQLASMAADLLARHGYRLEQGTEGPHTNVLSQPLFELPLWLAAAPGQAPLSEDTLRDICESSLCGYLAVRVEDDFIDEGLGDPAAAMMLATFFRTRHHSLLATTVRSPDFWSRFEHLWNAYGEAMLLEQALHDPASPYGEADFEAVLARSQPLEIPALAVLAIQNRWDDQPALSQMVRHLVRATQIFDDYVDAPRDLQAGNYTLMVRQLGGADGREALLRGMVLAADSVVGRVSRDLDEAVGLGRQLGLDQLGGWAEDRETAMRSALGAMYSALFEPVGDEQPDRGPVARHDQV